MCLVEEFYKQHKITLGLTLHAGKEGLQRKIALPEAERPGLVLSGYLKHRTDKRILILGKHEMEYIQEMPPELREKRLKALLTNKTPAVIIARSYRPPEPLAKICQEKKIPLFRSKMVTTRLMNKLQSLLLDEFSPSLSYQGCLVEVFDLGILIQGESAVGKSEAALGLIQRGHRLIADDIVNVKRKENRLDGSAIGISQQHMEIRGIGIINVTHIYGPTVVKNNTSIDLVVKMEAWSDDRFYDRSGLDEKKIEILGLKIPFHILPVKSGREVVLLLETLALNHSLQRMGYHSAKEFEGKLLRTISRKKRA